MSTLGDYSYSSDVDDSRKATVPYQPAAEPSAPTEPRPVDVANQSDIKPSEAAEVPNVFTPSQPSLSSSDLSLYSLPSQAITAQQLSQLQMQLSQSYAETMDMILDNWKKQIEKDAELSREVAEKAAIAEGNRRQERVKSDAIAYNLEKRELATPTLHKSHLSGEAFLDNLRKATPSERMRIIGALSRELLEKIGKGPSSIAQIIEDSKKVTPYGMLPFVQAYLTEMLVINPLAAKMAVTDLSGSANGSALSLQMLPFSAMTLNAVPQVNLMLPSMQVMYASAEDTALSLKERFDKFSNMGGEKRIDEEFVNEFAKKTLDRVNSMEKWLPFRDVQHAFLPAGLRGDVAKGAALIALTTVLIFDTKAQAAYSNLSPEEFQSILAKGIPGNDSLNAVADKIKSLLREFPPNERVEYVSMLLDYIDRAPSMHFEDLKNFSSVLLSASQKIGTDVRAPIAAA